MTATASYGTKVKEIPVSSAKAYYYDSGNKVAIVPGTWKFDGDGMNDIPEVGNTEAYKAVFTPTSGSENYRECFTYITPSITRATGSVTDPAVKTGLVYNGEEQALLETLPTSSTGTVQYSLDGMDYTETPPMGKKAETYTVFYKVVGDKNHLDVEAQSIAVKIEKLAITVTAENKTSRVGQALAELTYTYTPELAAGDVFTGTLETDARPDATGDYSITQGDLALNENYTIDFHAGTYTVADKLAQSEFRFESIPSAVSKTYGDPEFSAGAVGAAEGSTVTYESNAPAVAEVDSATGKVTIKGAGTAVITAKASATAEYDAAAAACTLTVEKKTVTVKAKDQTAYVGDKAPALGADSYTVSGLVGEEKLTTQPTVKYVGADGSKIAPDMTKTGEVKISAGGAAASDNYTIRYEDGKLTITTRPFSGGSGGSPSGSSTVKTETSKNDDGSTTKTETKKDGTVTQTTTGKDGSVSKTETRKDGSSVTETKAADGSIGTVKTDKNGQTTAETTLSSKAIETAKRNGEAVKAPVEVKASRNSSTAPTVSIELPKGAGETKVEIPVSNATPGTVAVLVHADGTEEIVRDSIPTENGVQLTVNGDTTVKVMDNSKNFTDTAGHWSEKNIDFVSARGLLNGTSANTFSPNAPTSRAQLWTVLARQADADLTGGANWYEKAQAWAKEKGISDGANPNGTINRAQMVTMLWRAMGQPAAASGASFADVPADSYYAQAVAWAIENGITAGVGGGRFDPNSTCTRAQIATFLWRAMAE